MVHIVVGLQSIHYLIEQQTVGQVHVHTFYTLVMPITFPSTQTKIKVTSCESSATSLLLKVLTTINNWLSVFWEKYLSLRWNRTLLKCTRLGCSEFKTVVHPYDKLEGPTNQLTSDQSLASGLVIIDHQSRLTTDWNRATIISNNSIIIIIILLCFQVKLFLINNI